MHSLLRVRIYPYLILAASLRSSRQYSTVAPLYAKIARPLAMSSGGGETTNEKDLREVERLRARLADAGSASSAADGGPVQIDVPALASVHIDEGANKYVLVRAREPARDEISLPARRTFVVSKKGAPYHRNAAEPFVERLLEFGYTDVRITGGGRILLDNEERKVSIFGFSYGFGKGDHRTSAELVRNDNRYQDFDVTWSDDGY
mmetsp:Transcript_25533/g.39533  ORF Transcript_25533/g.39533 Transcript_25533/m.39533 type:complete len:205 (+) Transcript_25533:64-678(+)